MAKEWKNGDIIQADDMNRIEVGHALKYEFIDLGQVQNGSINYIYGNNGPAYMAGALSLSGKTLFDLIGDKPILGIYVGYRGGMSLGAQLQARKPIISMTPEERKEVTSAQIQSIFYYFNTSYASEGRVYALVISYADDDPQEEEQPDEENPA